MGLLLVVFASECGERGRNLGKILHMVLEKVTQSQELPHLMNVARWSYISNRFELITSRNDALFCEPESYVAYVFVAENAFI